MKSSTKNQPIIIIRTSNESYSHYIYRQQAELPSAVVEWLKDEVTLTDASVAKVQNYLTSDEVGLTKLSEILELEEEMVQHIEALLPKLKQKKLRPAIGRLRGGGTAATAVTPAMANLSVSGAGGGGAAVEEEAARQKEAADAKAAKATAAAEAKAKKERAAAVEARRKAEAAEAKAKTRTVAAKAKASKPNLFFRPAEQKKQNEALYGASQNGEMGKLEAAIAAGAEVDWHNPGYVSELSELE